MWNPEVYDKFKDERSAPFFDLLNLVETKPDLSIIDLGCGTGELTSKLLDYFENSKVLGIDSSAEMLEKSNHYKTARLHFENRRVEQQLEIDEKFDLIFFLMLVCNGAKITKNCSQKLFQKSTKADN